MAPYSLVSFLEMLKLSAEALSRAMHELGTLRGMIIAFKHIGDGGLMRESVPKHEREMAIEYLTKLTPELRALSVPCTKTAAERLKRLLMDDPELNRESMSILIESIESRLFDELDSGFVFTLDSTEAAHFEKSSFGDEVNARFPCLTYDIAESYKCYALGRATAAAFHAIRCLEGGFAAIWRCLSVADPISGFERNWGNRLRKIEEKIDDKWPSKTGRMSGDAKLFDEALGAIKGMQNPYRNATMHLDDKYTLEEAWHIIELVKGFMQKIASRMDENGLPLA